MSDGLALPARVQLPSLLYASLQCLSAAGGHLKPSQKVLALLQRSGNKNCDDRSGPQLLLTLCRALRKLVLLFVSSSLMCRKTPALPPGSPFPSSPPPCPQRPVTSARNARKTISPTCWLPGSFPGLPARPQREVGEERGQRAVEKEEKLVLLASSVPRGAAKGKRGLEVTVKGDAFEKFRGKNDIMANHSLPPPNLFSSGSEK